jgi:hypothetical protein
MGGGGIIKENGGGSEFNYDLFWYIARTIVNATVYPHPAQ